MILHNYVSVWKYQKYYKWEKYDDKVQYTKKIVSSIFSSHIHNLLTVSDGYKTNHCVCGFKMIAQC